MLQHFCVGCVVSHQLFILLGWFPVTLHLLTGGMFNFSDRWEHLVNIPAIASRLLASHIVILLPHHCKDLKICFVLLGKCNVLFPP